MQIIPIHQDAAALVVPAAPITPHDCAAVMPYNPALTEALETLGLKALATGEIHPRLASRLLELPAEWRAAYAGSTQHARRSDLRRLAVWCAAQGRAPLASEDALCRAVPAFLVAASEWLGAASLRRAGSHLARFLESLGLSSGAVEASYRRRLVVRAKNRAARSRDMARQTEGQEGKRWLSAAEIAQLEVSIEDAPLSALARARDRAIFVLMIEFLLRRGDITDFRLSDWDPARGRLFLSGLGAIETISERAATPIFTALHKSGGLCRKAGLVLPLTGRSVSRILAEHAARVGITGVSGHTPRRSVARLMHEAGYSDEDIQRAGRWESVEVMRGYVGLCRVEEGMGDFLARMGI